MLRCLIAVIFLTAACSDSAGDDSSESRSSANEYTPAADESPSGDPTPKPPTEPEQRGLAGEAAETVEVIDGDTIDVLIDGIEERVRYIGIDAPERGACFEDAATTANSKLVDGRLITLEADVENNRDSFGRLLRYVHVDGMLVNEELVRLGVAEATTRFPERAYRDVLLEAEAEAKAEGRGLWSACPGLFE